MLVLFLSSLLRFSKQIHLIGKRFGLKIHQNNQFLLFVDVSVSQRPSSEEEATSS